MITTKTICNMCGKEMNKMDIYCTDGWHTRIGYGSIHDNDSLDLDLCVDCFDALMLELKQKCKYDPITSDTNS